MARNTGFFGPSDRALEFGAQYAQVLAKWAELFRSASDLVQANVELGRLANDAGKEWESWLRATANAPWNWMNPETMRRMAQSFMPPE